MSIPHREVIIGHMITALRGITRSAGYNHDMAWAGRQGDTGYHGKLPSCFVKFDTHRRQRELTLYSTDTEIDIEVRYQTNSADSVPDNEGLSLLVEDVETAMVGMDMQDDIRANLASMVTALSDSIAGEKIRGAIVTLTFLHNDKASDLSYESPG